MNEVWVDDMLGRLGGKTQGYSEQENKNISRFYIEKLLKRIKAEKVIDDEDVFDKIESIINQIPDKIDGERLKFTSKYLREISNLKSIIRKKYNYVPNGFYKVIFMPIGLPIGTSIGVAMKNIGLGISLGLVLGLILGGFLDKKAEKENRVI